jgi:hypothetical protein
MIQEVKEKYISEFPEEIEGVTVIFEFVNFLNNGAYLKNNIERTPRRDQVFQELTEYQFLLTDFIRFNRDDKEFLNLFWIALENIAKQKEALQKLHSLRRSILSQVAVYCILEKLGKKPSIAHPAEDAFHAIDLWSDKENQAIQIEGTPAESPFIIETSEIGFPSVVIDGTKKQQKYFSTETATKFQKFKLKLDAYGREIHKDLKGYLLVVPYSKFDFVTGEPSDDIVEFMRSKITQNDDKHD